MKPINLKTFKSDYVAMAGHVEYMMGAKAVPLDKALATITHLDCSGFAQLMIYRNAGEEWPEGSSEQWDHCRNIGLHQLVKYDDLQCAKADASRIFVAYSPDPDRHTWFICEGMTRESHGHCGVGSRAWDDPLLRRIARAVYELPAISGIG